MQRPSWLCILLHHTSAHSSPRLDDVYPREHSCPGLTMHSHIHACLHFPRTSLHSSPRLDDVYPVKVCCPWARAPTNWLGDVYPVNRPGRPLTGWKMYTSERVLTVAQIDWRCSRQVAACGGSLCICVLQEGPRSRRKAFRQKLSWPLLLFLHNIKRAGPAVARAKVRFRSFRTRK